MAKTWSSDRLPADLAPDSTVQSEAKRLAARPNAVDAAWSRSSKFAGRDACFCTCASLLAPTLPCLALLSGSICENALAILTIALLRASARLPRFGWPVSGRPAFAYTHCNPGTPLNQAREKKTSDRRERK
jgi:hypothetical protein